MARKIITGIDIGTSTIKVVIAEKKSEGSLNILGISQKSSRGMRRGYIINLEEISKSIKSALDAAEKKAGIRVKSAYVGIGGISLGSIKARGSVMVSRADGEVTEHDIKRALEQCESSISKETANKEIIHEIPLSFKVDGNAALGSPIGTKGEKLETECLYITCINQHLADLVKSVEMCGITIEDIIASPVAASSVAVTRHQKEVGCVLANLGASTISLIVFEEGIPISLEIYPIGSTHITNDIALGLQVPLEEAEKIKIEYGAGSSISKKRLSDIIVARLNDIFELIESHLKKIRRNGLLPAGIILTGGGSNLMSLEEIAKASLRLPAKIATPLPVNNQDLNITGPYKDYVLNDPGNSVALGLCTMSTKNDTLKGKTEGKSPFNALKPAIKRWLKSFLP